MQKIPILERYKTPVLSGTIGRRLPYSNVEGNIKVLKSKPKMPHDVCEVLAKCRGINYLLFLVLKKLCL